MSFAIFGVWPLILVLLVISGLFSAAETAMTGASRGRLHQLERDGDRAAGRVNKLLADRESMIGAVLLGQNLINILSATLVGQVLEHTLRAPWNVVVSTGVMTILVFVFAEVLPKTLAITRSDDVARSLSIPTTLMVRTFQPFLYAVQWVVRRTLALFGARVDMTTDVLAAHEEIRGAVEFHHSEGAVEARDRNMFRGVLDLAERDVNQVMVHRKNIAMLDADLDAPTLIEQALEIGHTRIPLYRDNPENVVAVLHARDLMQALARAEGRLGDIDIASVAREAWFIPETTSLKAQLNAFLKKQNHFALVVDEYGALMGLVTLEDILEEIVGEIEDEHDATLPGLTRQADGSVHVDGALPIRDLNRAMDWDLPDDEAVTVAGLVIHEAQTIPDPGQTFIFHKHRFQVLRRQRNQITALRVSPPLEPETAAT